MTLLAPLFLAGLLAVGLPLWLHRLSSDNPNRQRFSSLMFLEAGEPRRVLAKKLQYLLLLALRIALLVLLVLAFVQPAFWREPQAASGDGARMHVIVLDASASMAAGDRWERAVDAAGDIVDSLAPDDRAQLVAAGRAVEVVTEPTTDRAVLRRGLVSTRPGVFHLNFGQLTRSLDGIVRGAELPVVLHLVTDAQETGLPTRFAELAPRESAALEVHDVSGAETNTAVESLAGSALDGELTAVVRNFRDEPVRKTLRLELNGGIVEEQALEIPASGRAEATFGALALEAGSNRVRATLTPGDDLTLDDTRIVALKRPEPRPVLLVAGDLRGESTLFAAAAMDSLEGLALDTVQTTAADLADEDLARYAFVVVSDAGALGAEDSARLEDYVESGGSLLLALGPRSASLTEVPVTGQLFGPSAGVSGDRSDYFAVGALDTTHPALRGLDTMRAVKFFRHAAIMPAAEDRVLASLENGGPLLLERPLGDGRVLLLTSSLDREWNDLPVQPVFVPLIAGLANHMLGGAGFSNEAALGSTLALRAVGMQGGQIFDPAGEAALGLRGTADVLLDQIGFYEIAGGGSTELVAVNFDARESDLRAVDAATIERWQALGNAGAAADAGPVAGRTAEPALAPVGYWLLFLVLLAAAMESWVGNWHLRIRRGIAA